MARSFKRPRSGPSAACAQLSISESRELFAEREGNGTLWVRGKVKAGGENDSFDCRANRSAAEFYHGDAPSRHRDKDGSDLGVGAWLTIAASASGDPRNTRICRPPAADQCRDEPVCRVREKRQGRDLTGEREVHFDPGRPYQLSGSRQLDRRGGLRDSSHLRHCGRPSRVVGRRVLKAG
ncbi:MAG: hypothetical protein MUC77_05290 [Chromatiaceae bacterium]|jgi:hypothetical protein|nr:hypothetical protein [Chromatiaceae bacterium]